MEDYKKLRKWGHYADNAKKFRTRKKYRRKLREHHLLPLYYAPSNILELVAAPHLGCWCRSTNVARGEVESDGV